MDLDLDLNLADQLAIEFDNRQQQECCGSGVVVTNVVEQDSVGNVVEAEEELCSSDVDSDADTMSDGEFEKLMEEYA